MTLSLDAILIVVFVFASSSLDSRLIDDGVVVVFAFAFVFDFLCALANLPSTAVGMAIANNLTANDDKLELKTWLDMEVDIAGLHNHKPGAITVCERRFLKS